MGVATTTYGTIKRVQSLVGDAVTSRVFSTSTTPTKEEVERFLDDSADELNSYLESSDYTTPVSQVLDPTAYGRLRLVNTQMAAKMVLMARPTQATGQSKQSSLNRAEHYQARWDAMIKSIEDGSFQTTRSVGLDDDMAVGSYTDPDTGFEKLPLFTRSGTSYPGSEEFTRT